MKLREKARVSGTSSGILDRSAVAKCQTASTVESLLNANPRLANRRDEDDRLPIHWAVSYNHLSIVSLLVQSKGFDVDAQVWA